MNWVRLAAIIIGAGIVTSLTDWFFAGDWIHRRYTYPEIWRQGEESRAIALTSPLPFVTCGSICLCRLPAEPSFCIERAQIGGCGVGDRPVASDPHERRIYEAA